MRPSLWSAHEIGNIQTLNIVWTKRRRWTSFFNEEFWWWWWLMEKCWRLKECMELEFKRSIEDL